LVEVDVAEIERDGFLAAKPGRIDQLHERAIPKRERIVPKKRVERAFDLALPWRVRQPAGPSWRERRVGDARRPEREAQEAPNGGQLPADRRRGELAASCSAELRRVLGERPDVDVLELDPAPRKLLAELAHVDSVGLSGRVRKGRGGEKAFDRRFGVHVNVIRAPVTIACRWTNGSRSSRA